MLPPRQNPVPAGQRELSAMTKTKPTLINDHTDLSWGQKGLLEFIHQNSPTKAEVQAATSDSPYATENRLKELKVAKLVKHKQEKIVGRGTRFGESRYHVTELGLGLLPAGDEG